MLSEDHISRWMAELDRLDADENFEAIVQSVRSMLELAPKDRNVMAVSSARLIDAGACLGDIAVVSEGRSVVEAILTRPSGRKETGATHQYNLSNAFAAEYHIYQREGEAEKARESLLSQRRLLQELLLRERTLPTDLRIKVHTNCANALDETGRSVEAIDHFVAAWRLNPAHMLAKGNCGFTLTRLAPVSGARGRHNLDAGIALLEEACAAPQNILAYAPPSAVANLVEKRDKARAKVERLIKNGLHGLEAWRTHRREVHGQPPAPAWLARIVGDRLLLSLNQFPLASEQEALDDLFFATLSSGSDSASEEWALGLIYVLNAIKEEFAVARYLYYQAIDSQSEDTTARSKVTTYADAGTFAEFGLAVGLLKAGFRTSIDILDKIAFFLNAYMKLGLGERQVSFGTVWYRHGDRTKGEHPTVQDSRKRNIWLRALSDLRDDWFADRFPGPFRDLRNIGTHRGLVLFSTTEEGAADGIRTIDDHAIEALLMLRSVKAAIEYLVLFTNAEEKERMATAKKEGRMLTRPLNLRPGRSESK